MLKILISFLSNTNTYVRVLRKICLNISESDCILSSVVHQSPFSFRKFNKLTNRTRKRGIFCHGRGRKIENSGRTFWVFVQKWPFPRYSRPYFVVIAHSLAFPFCNATIFIVPFSHSVTVTPQTAISIRKLAVLHFPVSILSKVP